MNNDDCCSTVNNCVLAVDVCDLVIERSVVCCSTIDGCDSVVAVRDLVVNDSDCGCGEC